MNKTVQTASDSAPLWQAFERGELRLPTCAECGQPHLPAGPVCPYCLSSELEWRQASGVAVISTWVVERKKWFKAFDPPYIVAEVQLQEGPRMPARVAIEHLPLLRAGVAGRIVFSLAPNGINLPLFEPDGGR